jgi:signal transduction histidine kinase
MRMQANEKSQVKILFVDDDPFNADIFVLNFADQYTIFTASSGPEALEIFTRYPDIGIILSDHRMPGMSGVELLSRIYQLNPDTIRIIVTAFAEIGNLLEAINRGHIYHFVVKPWDSTELAIVLEQGIKVYNLTAENKRLIVEHREMHEKLRQLSLYLIHAQEDERRSLSMELHDDIGQNLIALKMQFENFCAQLPGRGDDDAEETRAIFQKTLRQTIESTRNVCEQLSPTIVEKFGLDQAINGFINDFCRDYRLTFSGEGLFIEHLLSKKDQHQVYRILQEVFNNIGKHSATDHISVASGVDDCWLSISVTDFGRGFDPVKKSRIESSRPRRGLATIKARATILGGRIEIHSKVRKGTTVTLKVPVERHASK